MWTIAQPSCPVNPAPQPNPEPTTQPERKPSPRRSPKAQKEIHPKQNVPRQHHTHRRNQPAPTRPKKKPTRPNPKSNRPKPNQTKKEPSQTKPKDRHPKRTQNERPNPPHPSNHKATSRPLPKTERKQPAAMSDSTGSARIGGMAKQRPAALANPPSRPPPYSKPENVTQAKKCDRPAEPTHQPRHCHAGTPKSHPQQESASPNQKQTPTELTPPPRHRDHRRYGATAATALRRHRGYSATAPTAATALPRPPPLQRYRDHRRYSATATTAATALPRPPRHTAPTATWGSGGSPPRGEMQSSPHPRFPRIGATKAT
jgi:hypothetical protein